jgi:twitching motility protein PilT
LEILRKILGALQTGAIKIVLQPSKRPQFIGSKNEMLNIDFAPIDLLQLKIILGILQGKNGPAEPPGKEIWTGRIALSATSNASVLAGPAGRFFIAIYLSPDGDAFFNADRQSHMQAKSSPDRPPAPAPGQQPSPPAKAAATAAPAKPAANAPAKPAAQKRIQQQPFVLAQKNSDIASLLKHYEANPLRRQDESLEIPWTRDLSAEIERTSEYPIDAVLADMVSKRASDVHLTMTEPIVYRIDGELERQGKAPITPEAMRAFLDPILPPANRKELKETNDTDFAYEVPNLGRFRFNCFRERLGVCAVVRHIPSKILTAEQLNLPRAVIELCNLPKGLVLVTGPTGSGKSTTLAAMLDYINRNRHEHILTIEDPVEFVHPQLNCLVNQREVHKHTRSFARALKAALREDPDIVLIGEMRDLETIAIAIETAETGHLVFGTLHTNTAISTVDRIIDQFPADRQNQIRTMLASSLRGVISQTLVKKKGSGRVAALEILITDDALSAMIREGKNHMIANHMQTSKAKGNILMNESLVKHVSAGTIELDAAFLKAPDKKGFIQTAKSAGVRVDSIEAALTAMANQAMQGGNQKP